jgi:ABC-type dipeptide/oligopeptide/nickel transport system permease subunit
MIAAALAVAEAAEEVVVVLRLVFLLLRGGLLGGDALTSSLFSAAFSPTLPVFNSSFTITFSVSSLTCIIASFPGCAASTLRTRSRSSMVVLSPLSTALPSSIVLVLLMAPMRSDTVKLPSWQIEQMRLYTHINYIIMQPVRIAGLYSGVYDYFNIS